MKKFMNAPAALPAEALAGFVSAHGDIVRFDAAGRYVARSRPATGKVALIAGGGSGHEPMHAGYVGLGMLDAACPGAVFSSPTPDQMTAAAADLAGPEGVLFIVKNYQGDRMNFEIAMEMAELAHPGRHRLLIVADDAGAPAGAGGVRRGVAGTVIIERLLGAAAERGMPLDALLAFGHDLMARTRTIGVALESCTVPEAGRPTFAIDAGEMEFGVGIHGEAGSRREALKPADAIAAVLCEALRAELAPPPGAPVLLMVNGFGATPLIELHLMHGAARRILEGAGMTVARSLVGNFATSLDMAGCSITLSVMDAATLDLWDSPVHTAALRWRA